MEQPFPTRDPIEGLHFTFKSDEPEFASESRGVSVSRSIPAPVEELQYRGRRARRPRAAFTSFTSVRRR